MIVFSDRKSSADNRTLSPFDRLFPNSQSYSAQSPARPHSAGSASLQVPGINDNRSRSSDKNGNSARSSQPRSRSYSPFGISRGKLPCGSPAFEKVLCDMLSDSDLSDSKTDEVSIKIRTDSKKKRSNRVQRKTPLSPRSNVRK